MQMQQAVAAVLPAEQQQGAWHTALTALPHQAQGSEHGDAPASDSKYSLMAVGAAAKCPAGCIDLGFIASVLGMPWPCFCQTWMLGDLTKQLQTVSLVYARVCHSQHDTILSAVTVHTQEPYVCCAAEQPAMIAACWHCVQQCCWQPLSVVQQKADMQNEDMHECCVAWAVP